jgi:predicted Zn-dependent protease
MNLPEDLLRNPHFSRYYRTWRQNQSSVVFIPLAQICREQGFPEEAREICETGLAHHPHSVSGRLMLARIYFDLERWNDARRIVEEILGELPGQKEAKSLLDRIRRCRGEPEKPEPLRQGHPLWENVTMARIYADQGETKIARQMLERILSRNPQDDRARRLYEELR